EGLLALGYKAAGWDPVFRPSAPRNQASVVNVGYVINVIEDSAERIEVVRSAYALSTRLLVVSTLVVGQQNDAHRSAFRDGFLTKANTFQKFYGPGELESLLEETLDAEVVTLALGVCVVFRYPEEGERFEALRTRRHIDWTDLNVQLRLAA